MSRPGQVVVVAVLIALAGCGHANTAGDARPLRASQSPQSAASNAGADAPIVSEGGTIDVSDDVDGSQASVTVESSRIIRRDGGSGPASIYLAATVTLAGKGGIFDFDALQFRALDGEGNYYDPSSLDALGAGVTDDLGLGKLSTGQSSAGEVVYRVPEATGLSLTFFEHDRPRGAWLLHPTDSGP